MSGGRKKLQTMDYFSTLHGCVFEASQLLLEVSFVSF
jgi:hypothetical protein